MICATGYELDLPYLSPDLSRTLLTSDGLGASSISTERTLSPDLPTLGVVGQFLAQGPYFPLLELQARWVVGIWAGEIPTPDERRTCATTWRSPSLGCTR